MNSELLKNPIQVSDTLLVEEMRITPGMAGLWLKHNTLNRPLSRKHVLFLAKEIISGNWQMNGQGIVIAENENVLDGQHRLHAIIEAGKPIKTLVIYGVKEDAFKTIDTGKVRGGSDVLSLNFPEATANLCKTVATAIRWTLAIDSCFLSRHSMKTSNTEILKFVTNNPSLWRCAEIILGYPKNVRPLSVGPGTGLFFCFHKKDVADATYFIRRFYTGEQLKVSDGEYILRDLLIKDLLRKSRIQARDRVRAVIKTWNGIREGKKITARLISSSPDEKQKLKLL